MEESMSSATPKKMRPITYAVAVGIVAASSATMSACRRASADPRDANTEEPPIKVETSIVAVRTLPHQLTLTGTLVANQEADVAADASGKIQQTFVERGSFVQRGAALARVDARSAVLSRAEAAAQVRVLEAQNEMAKSDCARVQKLFSDGSISRAEFERQTSQCQTTQFTKEAADARAQMAGKALGDATIRAPFSGLVAERFVTAGEYVRPDTRVVTLVDVDMLRLELTVQESAIDQIHEGQTVRFKVASSRDPFTAQIRYVGPAVRRTSRDLVVEAVVVNADHKLRPGMFATAKVELGTYDSPMVPSTALRDSGVSKHVFVVVQNKLEERVVETGDVLGDEIAIASGVKPGERVVSKVREDVRDGVRVE
jgi:membrane fusion protein (multidrug efflux system)